MLNFGHFHPEDFFKEDVPVASLSGQGLFAEPQGAAHDTPANMPTDPDKKQSSITLKKLNPFLVLYRNRF